jgi:SAM-dependent methyltransferase
VTQPVMFDFNDLFDAEEYLYFMEESLVAENTPAQVDFLVRATAIQPGARVLDLGCGHGRHSIELAKRGFDVTGVDLVEGFLDVGRKAAEETGVKVNFVRGDIAGFETHEPYDAALCLFDAFGFFDDAHSIKALRCAHGALSMGGRFVLDLRTREWMTRLPSCAVSDKGNGDMMVDRHHFDIGTSRFVDRRTYVRDGKQREVMFSVRLYAFTEIRLILHTIGFEMTAAFGGFEETPISAAKPRMVLLCTKIDPPTESTV